MNFRLIAHGVMAAVWGAACGDSSTTIARDAAGERLYVLWSGTSGAELSTNYITPLGSLEPGAVVDYGRAVEQPGVTRLYGQEGVGFFAVGDGESQTITRYEIDERDRFVPGATLSLQPFGVTLLADATSIHFVDANKAYYI